MSKNPLDALPGNLGNNLGEYLREQRLLAKLSVRQLSALAGVSNPYLSQIERGVKRPSAEILQQIAKGLSISAETLYVQAGLLDPKDAAAEAGANTRAALRKDPSLTPRQRQTLLEIYESFVGADQAAAKTTAETDRPAPRSRSTRTAATQGAGTTAARAKSATKTSQKVAKKKSTATRKKGSTTASRSTTSTPSSSTSTSRRKA